MKQIIIVISYLQFNKWFISFIISSINLSCINRHENNCFTFARVPSTQYPAIITPFLRSVHHCSNSSRDKPLWSWKKKLQWVPSRNATTSMALLEKSIKRWFFQCTLPCWDWTEKRRKETRKSTAKKEGAVYCKSATENNFSMTFVAALDLYTKQQKRTGKFNRFRCCRKTSHKN